MIYKILSPKPNHVRVIFELPAGVWADRIFVVGDFNDWCVSATPMCQDRDGVWRVTADLAVGSQSEFRYLIDGQWSTDHHADGFTTNVYGTDNSVIEANLPDGMLTLARACSQVWDSPQRKFSPATTGCQPTMHLIQARNLAQPTTGVKAHADS